MIEVKGYNGQITFDGSTVTILRKGGLARASVGKGSKAIPVQHITAVQLKPAGLFVNGFIQFTIGGGNERRSKPGRSTTDAAKDENSVIFRKSQASAFKELAAAIQERIAAGLTAPAAASVDMADELEKLAGLHSAGALSDDEFASAKAKLLG